MMSEAARPLASGPMSSPPVPPGAILFEDGIPGFPDARAFIFEEIVDGGAFQLLKSLDDPALGFVVAAPWLFFPDYAPELDDIDQAGLGVRDESDVAVFCAVTLDGERRAATMNLVGPFVVNVHTRRGRQVVLTGQDYPLKAPLPVSLG